MNTTTTTTIGAGRTATVKRDPSPAERLIEIATAHKSNVQAMANAALLFGLIHDARLDPLILNLTARIDELAGDAFEHLADAVISEGRKRRRTGGKS